MINTPENENLPWILLDSICHQFHTLTDRSHGRRNKQSVNFTKINESQSYVRELDSKQRSVLTRWMYSCKKAKSDYSLEPKVLEALGHILKT